VEGGVGAAAEEEAVRGGGTDIVEPDDLARGVDAVGLGATRDGHGIVEGGVSAAAEEEAVKAGVVTVPPDDLPCGVDALWTGFRQPAAGRRIVEGGVGVDWHGCCPYVAREKTRLIYARRRPRAPSAGNPLFL